MRGMQLRMTRIVPTLTMVAMEIIQGLMSKIQETTTFGVSALKPVKELSQSNYDVMQ